MAKNKCSTYESYEREKFIISCISQGIPRLEIEKNCSKEWAVTPRQVQNYYYKVLKKIKKSNEKGRLSLMTKLQTQYEMLYAKAYKDNDKPTCRMILSDMAKMFGGFEEDNKDVHKIIVKPPKLD